MTNYTRVIPRDFFNESKLLKCFGQLSLAILDGKTPEGIRIVIEETGEPFEIELSDSGSLRIANYETFLNGKPVVFSTRYNSKRNYPFYCEDAETGEEIEVFTDEGKFAEEFIIAFGERAA